MAEICWDVVIWFANLRLAVGKWVCWAASCWHFRAFRHGSSDPASCLIHVAVEKDAATCPTHTHKQKEKKTTLTQDLLRMDTLRDPLIYWYSHDPECNHPGCYRNLSINRDDRRKCPDPSCLGHIRQVHLNNAFHGIKTGFDMHLFLLCRMIQLGCEPLFLLLLVQNK